MMKTIDALKLVGGLSKPSKMPGWAYGIPAKECKTGSKLREIKNSTCHKCYALKGCYVFKVVQEAQYKRLAAIKHPQWVTAMVYLISSKTSGKLCKVQATSVKQQASSYSKRGWFESFINFQGASGKLQAPSSKHQAASHELLAL
jgi:hypothetical protein